jgi:predicted DNA-binding transcriptional regulator YafY
MSAEERIVWLHKKIAAECYPNSAHLVERFAISQRQAQRDFETLKAQYSAPLKYSPARRGYFYTCTFELPFGEEKTTESEYIDILSNAENTLRDEADELQLKVPYTASLEIHDKLTVMNMRRFIVSKEKRNVYNCEFYNVDNFLGIMLVCDADIRIVKPEWLRERAIETAKRILKNNEK